jgi:hypothetical protein
MHFSQLYLERLILEIRYNTGYLYWDHCGVVIKDVITKFPKIEPQNVNVQATQLSWGEEGFVLTFNNEKFDISQGEVTSTTLFKDLAAHFYGTIFSHFELKAFTRAGVRFIYVYPTESKEEADKLLSTSRLFCSEPKEAEPFGHITERELMLRVEGEHRGYAIRLSAASRQVIKTGVTKPLTLNSDKFHPNVVTFDVDCYTKKAGDASILSVPDFIRTSERMIEDNLMPLVGVADAGNERRSKR